MSKAVQHLQMIKIKDEYGTRLDVFYDACRKYDIHPTLDVAASPINHVCDDYWTKADDFLTKEVPRDFFMNAPYSEQYVFMEHAHQQAKDKNLNALILAYAKTDTNWWHDFVEEQAEIHFIKGRLKFYDETGMIPRVCKKCSQLDKTIKYHNIERCPLHNVALTENTAPYPSCWIIFRAA